MPESTAVFTNKRVPIPDADIAQAIRRHMQEDGALRSAPVHVAVSEGICTLEGSVGNLLAKERALRVAETIRGVRSVIDKVDVSPVAKTDQQLQSDVTRELKRDSATRPYAIGVTTKDGKVTSVTHHVAANQLRSLCARRIGATNACSACGRGHTVS